MSCETDKKLRDPVSNTVEAMISIINIYNCF